jgi:hypothetical protein
MYLTCSNIKYTVVLDNNFTVHLLDTSVPPMKKLGTSQVLIATKMFYYLFSDIFWILCNHEGDI